MILPDVSIRKILYATDLSANARYAFSHALNLANRCGATITILHVIPEDSPKLDNWVVGYVSQSAWDAIKEKNLDQTRETLIGKKRDSTLIREVLSSFSREVKDGSAPQAAVEDEIVIQRGNPVQQILEQAAAHGCDLIVMGTRGHGTLADVMMGSVASRVLRRSKIPVLVVPHPEPGA
jgi:nucleotide-binding universal stress UspA family protein